LEFRQQEINMMKLSEMIGDFEIVLATLERRRVDFPAEIHGYEFQGLLEAVTLATVLFMTDKRIILLENLPASPISTKPWERTTARDLVHAISISLL
jgi:hypothetical protein